jgi:hypothetical protein
MIHKFVRKQDTRPRLEHHLADQQHWPQAVETFPPVFYIRVPGYTARSGGVMACHVLCHELNRLGYEAYVATEDVSGTLWTPMLTRKLVLAHNKTGRRPIAIYPELYLGNDFKCDRVIRYLLNRPGVISDFAFAVSKMGRGAVDVDKLRAERITFSDAFWQSPARKSEFHIHFAEDFRMPYLNSVPLYTPIVDEGIFFEEVGSAEREGFVVYSRRRKVRDAMVPDWARPYTLVSPASPRTPHELAHLYRRSRGLIVFERTGARMEAAMCGCPVVAIPSEGFSQLPLFDLYGNLGQGWGPDVEQFHWAQRTLGALQCAYRAYARAYPARLAEVVEAALRFFADRSPG